jgi:hypothetical protein
MYSVEIRKIIIIMYKKLNIIHKLEVEYKIFPYDEYIPNLFYLYISYMFQNTKNFK